ncbi:MAG: hypothetical protein ABSB11_11180 [Sedimentisphaerales bacterium]|jgi:hypothetical protein
MGGGLIAWLHNQAFQFLLNHKAVRLFRLRLRQVSSPEPKAVLIITSAWDKTRGIGFICSYRHERLACEDVIEYILAHKAVEDLENRIEAIEQRPDQHK